MEECRFCKGYYESLKTEKISILENNIIQLENNKLEILTKDVDSVFWDILYSIEIEYCPMCGKKLGSKEIRGDK